MRKLLRLFALPFAFLTVLVIRALRPWLLVRLGDTWSARLGHLIGNTECYLCECDAGLQPANRYDIWMHRDVVCNRYIAGKYAARLHMWPGWWGSLVVLANQSLGGGERHVVEPAQYDRDIHNLFARYAPHIAITAREERRGRKQLRELGIPAGAKWVCLMVRDAAYLAEYAKGGNWSYHNYRDSEIDTYIWAAVALAKRGYYVVRMGETAMKPLMVKHSKIIDYPFSGKRTEFGDLYLGAKCAFYVGACTGFTAIPWAFGRPMALVNCVPIDYMPTFDENTLAIWKHHVKDGRRMTIPEISQSRASEWTFGHQFVTAGITLQDNSEAEIVQVALELADRVEGTARYSDEEETMQRRFWSEFPLSVISPYNSRPLHGHAALRIGREFLKEYYALAQQCSPIG